MGGIDICTCTFYFISPGIMSLFCPCMVTWEMATLLGESCCMPCFPGNVVAMRTKTRALGGIKVQ